MENQAEQLCERLLRANRKHLKRLMPDLIRKLPPSEVSSLLALGVQIGAWTAVSKPSRWQQLPAHLLSVIFGFLEDYERLIAVERACNRWSDASHDGAGWQELTVSNRLSSRSGSLEHFKVLAASGRLAATHTVVDLCADLWVSWLPSQLRSLTLNTDGLADPQLTRLPDLVPKLHTLHLVGKHSRSYQVYAALATMSELRTVSLQSAMADAVDSFSKLPLTALDLSQCLGPITSRSLGALPATMLELKVKGVMLVGHVDILARCPNLIRLHIRAELKDDRWTQRDLDAFVELPCCKNGTLKHASLVLSQCNLDGLCSVTSLQSLDLTLAETTDSVDGLLLPLLQLSCLRRLVFTEGKLTDAGLELIGQMKRLDSLALMCLDHITDKGIAHLRSLRINTLDLRSCDGLRFSTLDQLRGVHNIELAGTNVGTHGIGAGTLLKLADRDTSQRLETLTLFGVDINAALTDFAKQWRRHAHKASNPRAPVLRFRSAW